MCYISPWRTTASCCDRRQLEVTELLHGTVPLIVMEKDRSLLSEKTVNLAYTSADLLHHFFMSHATEEVASG